MYLHTEQLINEILPDEPDPAAANALQEGLGGQFGEMRTMMQYLFQCINFRDEPSPSPTRTCCRVSAPKKSITPSCTGIDCAHSRPRGTTKSVTPKSKMGGHRTTRWPPHASFKFITCRLSPIGATRRQIQRPVSRAVRIEMRPAGDMSWSPSLPASVCLDHITALHHHEGLIEFWDVGSRGHGRGGPRSRRHRPPGRAGPATAG